MTRAEVRLFAVSGWLLFLELACIRWFPAHVIFLTFFTNTVLIAAFLGMSLGCLLSRQRRNLLLLSGQVLSLGMAAAILFDRERDALSHIIRVADRAAPEVVYFGTEGLHLGQSAVPMEAVMGLFFLLVALAMMGPGQMLGRALDEVRGPLRAYGINIAGSIAGILLFTLFAWLELGPPWWFIVHGAMLIYGLGVFAGDGRFRLAKASLPLAALPVLLAVGLPSRHGEAVTTWSPYYRVDFEPKDRSIAVNLIGHQTMISRRRRAPAYALPHLLERDSGGPPFHDVLIIGAGSGNDTSRALAFGARHIDAVEIDPAILDLGRRLHPDRPYGDPRVTALNDDGRHFLKATNRKYDLVVYALVDSLVLHTGYSSLRLESFLFTREAFQDVKRHLKPGGVFAMYNFFRQGKIVARLNQALTETFGTAPLCLTLPYQAEIADGPVSAFTLFLAGNIDPVRRAFKESGRYLLPLGSRSVSLGRPHDPPNGFQPGATGDENSKGRFAPATISSPGKLRIPTDDWPFLYLMRPAIPALSWRGILVMGGCSLLLGIAFLGRSFRLAGSGPGLARMFFLGAGFMLLETGAITQTALLFGSTWLVNAMVFLTILLLALAANGLVAALKPTRFSGWYMALFAALILRLLLDPNRFLGLAGWIRAAAGTMLVLLPILFAGVIFSATFRLLATPHAALALNIAGAILGGLAESSSMILGFRRLTLVVLLFYLVSMVATKRGVKATAVEAAG